MSWRDWLISSTPVGLGFLIWLLASNEFINNPVVFMRASLAALAIAVGVSLSAITGAVLLGVRYYRNRQEDKRRRLQQKAADERRRFLQRLDHELKNPLTAIRAGLSNVESQSLDDYVSGEIAAIQTQTLRISRLVTDLRKLSSLEIAPLETTQVNMAELLRDVANALETAEHAQARTLSVSLPSAPWPLPDVAGDPDLLVLAVHNLLDNAIKFTASGDTIEVRAFEDGSEIVIEVADTGPGIAVEEIQRVWDELYRGEQARGVPGSGLGLPLIRAIIEKHGGNVALRSKPQQGTVFSIRLPTG